ncbi:gamma-glutamyl-gamma-aminobutyrate hydrolase family protein, partial [Enterococcus faecium]
KPIFAVCRGLQLLNVVLEGTLYQDLSLYPKWSVKHEQQPTAPQFATHEVKIVSDSLLSDLLPDSYFVNSYHHQAVKDLSPLLKAIAFSNDGL